MCCASLSTLVAGSFSSTTVALWRHGLLRFSPLSEVLPRFLCFTHPHDFSCEHVCDLHAHALLEDALLEIATSLGGSIPTRASMAAFDDAARTHDRHVSCLTARLTPNEKATIVSETSHSISDLLKQILGNLKSVDKEKTDSVAERAFFVHFNEPVVNVLFLLLFQSCTDSTSESPKLQVLKVLKVSKVLKC